MKLGQQAIAALLVAPLANRPLFKKLLATPPSDVELDALVLALLGVASNSFVLGNTCRTVAPRLIRALLDEPLPPRAPPWSKHWDRQTLARNLIFLKQAVPRALDDATLETAWRTALQALLDLQTTYSWGSKQRRAKIAAVARAPRLLEAVQAAAVAADGAATLGEDFLAVLVADGSEASADALLPHFHRALTDGSGLELLEQLRTHAAATPANQAMLAKVQALLGERSAASPVLTLAPRFGLDGDVRELWFDVYLGSTAQTRGNVSLVQASVAVDSRRERWLRISLSRVEPGPSQATTFDNARLWCDDLQLGRCALDELPAYFARAAERLAIEWRWEAAGVRSSLRGQKRAAVLSWLRGSHR